MNKTQLIDRLAERTGLPRAQAAAVVQTLFDPASGLIAEALRGGSTLTLHEFGSFGVRESPARKGRDPRTGREIDIPARRSCTFRARKGLRSSMKDMVGA